MTTLRQSGVGEGGRDGPDIAIIGASRAGSTVLADELRKVPEVIASKVKEPNYFSVYYGRGFQWYASLFGNQRGDADGVWLDASTTYAYPQHAVALDRLADLTVSRPTLVYLVRTPLERAISQFVHEEMYLKAADSSGVVAIADPESHWMLPSRYDLVLEHIGLRFEPTDLVVVPFELVTTDPWAAVRVIAAERGVAVYSRPEGAPDPDHKNNRVIMRNASVARGFDRVRDTRLYARARGILGETAARKIRAMLTTEKGVPTTRELLGELSAADLKGLRPTLEAARGAVDRVLRDQDDRLGLDWRATAGWIDKE